MQTNWAASGQPFLFRLELPREEWQSRATARMKKQTNKTIAPSAPALPRFAEAQPFLKWAGGKRQLLGAIRSHLPQTFGAYFEPFIGAGAVLLDLQPVRATINDTNGELVNCYRMIKDHPDELIEAALRHAPTKEHFYATRELDRDTAAFKQLSDVERAARIIFLNKTCFNGLFRVNSRGHFNVPFGDYKRPKIVEPTIIRAISGYLNSAEVEILHGDFEAAVKEAKSGDLVYFDPPYDPLSDTSSFTGYSAGAFGKEQQQRLKALADRLHDQGCFVLLSNSATEFIKELYSDSRYSIVEVAANRNINSVGTKRQKISEVLIFNHSA